VLWNKTIEVEEGFEVSTGINPCHSILIDRWQRVRGVTSPFLKR